MRPVLSLVGLVAAATLVAGCGATSNTASSGSSSPATDSGGQISVFAPPSYMAPEETDGFAAQFPSYSIKVLPMTSTSSAPQVINQNPDNYDVAWLDTASGPQMAQQGGLATFNPANVPNLQYVDLAKWVSPEALAGFPKDSCVPTDVLKEGFVYDSSVIAEPMTSWSDFFRVAQEHPGKVLYTNSPRDAFSAAQIALGIDPNTEDPDLLTKAQDLLKQFKPTVLSFDNVNVTNAFLNGSVVMGFNYDGVAGSLLKSDPNLKWVTPSDGSATFVQMYCLLKGGQGMANGIEKWFNHVLTPSVAVKHTEKTGLASPEADAVYPLLSGDLASIATAPQYEPAAKPVTLAPVSPQTTALMNRMWQEVISG
ncbi:ABC transporter substrate-binding protein [Pseudonocardia oroxyli]|uniref:Spermidine/putrescine-binding protein n=1 Tax=Pseudonocardia oroxyli TaxID=366584 RepID=A0A1G7SUJ3_PSEOR|nr:extracellular solute-binding protein [Pseudonocardia oroxyli]SDG25950.1 Spermidine/putrescine-binding protein [Pseudonocardia oroxyli]